MRHLKSRKTPIAISRDPNQSTAIAVLREKIVASLKNLDVLNICSKFNGLSQRFFVFALSYNMPRRLRKLFGRLLKVEDEHGHKAPEQTPTVRTTHPSEQYNVSYSIKQVATGAAAPRSSGHGVVDGGQTHDAPSPAKDTDGTHVEVVSHPAAPPYSGHGAVDGAQTHNAPSRAEDKDETHVETPLSGRNGPLSQTMAVDSDTTRSVAQTFSYWERAAEQLEDKEPSVFAALLELRKESSCPSKDMPSEISQIIEQHINTMENKQWSLPFKVRGREVKIRKQLDNVWKVLQIFNNVGYTLASVDPVHVGIPWAGVSFIVQGALNDSAQNIAAMEGLSQISLIVDRYLWMVTIYLGDQDRSDHEDFEKCLVDLYAGILKYQVAAACHCQRSTFSRFLRALPKVDDWAAMLQYIDKKDQACKDLASVLDSQSPDTRHETWEHTEYNARQPKGKHQG